MARAEAAITVLVRSGSSATDTGRPGDYLGTDLEENALEPDIAELIEAVFIPVPEVDAMIVRGEIDNVTALAGWALFRAAEEAK